MAILKAAVLARAPNAGLAAVGVFWAGSGPVAFGLTMGIGRLGGQVAAARRGG